MMKEDKTGWKKSYTWVLLANLAYVLTFYFLMQIFS